MGVYENKMGVGGDFIWEFWLCNCRWRRQLADESMMCRSRGFSTSNEYNVGAWLHAVILMHQELIQYNCYIKSYLWKLGVENVVTTTNPNNRSKER